MAVVIALSAVAMLVLLARGRITVATAGVALAVLLLGWVAAHELNDLLIDRNYGGRSFDEAETRLSPLVHRKSGLRSLERCSGTRGTCSSARSASPLSSWRWMRGATSVRSRAARSVPATSSKDSCC
jgi:hypothetical protein